MVGRAYAADLHEFQFQEVQREFSHCCSMHLKLLVIYLLRRFIMTK